jgi:hypothetical protein
MSTTPLDIRLKEIWETPHTLWGMLTPVDH